MTKNYFFREIDDYLPSWITMDLFMMLYSPESLACKSTIEIIAWPSNAFMFPRSPTCLSSEPGPPWFF